MKLASIGALALAAALVALAVAPLAGQSGASGAAPRTPWGDPDLQGVWEYWTFTAAREAGGAGRPGHAERGGGGSSSRNGSATRRSAGTIRARPKGRPAATTSRSGPSARGPRRLTQPSLLVDPPDGRIPPRTEAEQQRAAAHRDCRRGVRCGCAPTGRRGPTVRRTAPAWPSAASWGSAPARRCCPAATNNNIQIFQAEGYVVLLAEMVHDVRVVPVDGRPAPAVRHPPVAGQLARPLARGDTLVVETTNFTAEGCQLQPHGVRFRARPLPFHGVRHRRLPASDGALHAHGRPARWEYEFTIDDPADVHPAR